MPSIGLITYYYPPLSGGGINRMKELPPRLKKMGWEVVVYTPVPPSYISKDVVPSEDIPVVRIPSFDPLHIPGGILEGGKGRRDKVSFPDNKLGFIPFLLSRLKKHDVYIITAPPFSLLIAGLFLKSKGYRWVAEFRDPYTDGELGSYAFSLLNRLAKTYERIIVEKADAVVSLSPGLTSVLARRYRKKIFTITNGFAEEDFKQKTVKKNRDKFVLTYMGTFNRTHRPDVLIEAFRLLDERTKSRFVFQIIGNVIPEYLDKLNEFEFVHPTGFLERKQAVGKLLESHALLLLLTPEESPFAIPGKTFEYIRTGKPILLISGDGALKEFLGESAIHVYPEPGLIAKRIKDMVYKGIKTRPMYPSPYSWDRIAEKYSMVLWSVLSS